MKRKIYKDLESYIRETGTTQKELAKRLGVSQPCISMIRHGKRAPSWKLARAISAAARIPIDSLIPVGD